MERLCEIQGALFLVFESGHSYKLITQSEDAFLSLIGKDSEDGMKRRTEKKDDPGSLMDMERNSNPSKPRANLKQNQKHIQDTQDQND
jgi:hypothetical protein